MAAKFRIRRDTQTWHAVVDATAPHEVGVEVVIHRRRWRITAASRMFSGSWLTQYEAI